MNRKAVYTTAVLVAALCLAGCSEPSGISIGGMTTELRENPQGIDQMTPRLSWQVYSEHQGTTQTAYRIRVKNGSMTVWDSRKVDSDACVLVPYAGDPLEYESDYSWQVRVWTSDGESGWSAPATWSTGLRDSLAWGDAKWIGIYDKALLKQDPEHLPAKYIRKDLHLRRGVRSAKLYMSALGMGDASINGEKVCRELFAHPPVLFDKTVYYRTYDVTDMLHRGDNVLALILGCGRYQSLSARTLRSVSDPRAKVMLKVSYKGGGEDVFVSDTTWMGTHSGPITSNNEYDGEYYDARLEMPGWNDTGFAYSSIWHNVDTMRAPKGRLRAMTMDDMSVQDQIVAKSVRQVGPERYILDMGQNMTGFTIVTLQGAKDKPIVMKYAEKLTDAGDSLNMASLRRTLATDQYTPAADGEFTWVPEFPYHGFRYMQIEGVTAAPKPENVVGQVIYDKMKTNGSWTCSDERLNRLYKNAYCGIRSNYRGMPIDCPQRDERQGWLGDRGGTIYGEPYLFNVAPLYRKWMDDVYDSMKNNRISIVSPRYWSIFNRDMAASTVFLYMADMLYSRYGDDSGIVTYYPAMKAWFEDATAKNLKEDYIFRMRHDEYKDWIVPPESPEMIHAKDPSRITGSPVLQTGIMCGVLEKLIEFARYTGNDADVPAYEELLAKVKVAYNETFFDSDRACYDNNTQTANLIPLYFNLVPEGREDEVLANVVDLIENKCDGHLCVGNVGVRYVMRVLTEGGYVDLAYKLATIDTYPSWGYMIKKGATTVWELWNGDEAGPSMNSGCHAHLIGDLLNWFYEDLAGIKNDPADVAFRKVWMEPCFPRELGYVEASFDSPYGIIASKWVKDEEAGTLVWDINIPVGSTATVVVPETWHIDASDYESVTADGKVKLTLPSGQHHLATKGA